MSFGCRGHLLKYSVIRAADVRFGTRDRSLLKRFLISWITAGVVGVNNATRPRAFMGSPVASRVEAPAARPGPLPTTGGDGGE